MDEGLYCLFCICWAFWSQQYIPLLSVTIFRSENEFRSAKQAVAGLQHCAVNSNPSNILFLEWMQAGTYCLLCFTQLSQYDHICLLTRIANCRDIFNEKPAMELVQAEEGEEENADALPRGAVIHTTRGDISIRLHPVECPRTIENFATHARNGYYNNIIFHRVIKGFMIQTGDPLGECLILAIMHQWMPPSEYGSPREKTSMSNSDQLQEAVATCWDPKTNWVFYWKLRLSQAFNVGLWRPSQIWFWQIVSAFIAILARRSQSSYQLL